MAAVVGIYLGLLWLATGNLLVPIVTHGVYDFAALVWLLRRYHAQTLRGTLIPDSSLP